MGRLRLETLERVEGYAGRVLDVVDALERQRRSRRIVDRLAGAGTSVGANVFEADEAMTAKDLAKTTGVVVRELNESRFWLRLAARRGWGTTRRPAPLLQETEDLKAMFGSMIVRTRKAIRPVRKKSSTPMAEA